MAPTGRGAEPQVLTMVPSAARWPFLRPLLRGTQHFDIDAIHCGNVIAREQPFDEAPSVIAIVAPCPAAISRTMASRVRCRCRPCPHAIETLEHALALLRRNARRRPRPRGTHAHRGGRCARDVAAAVRNSSACARVSPALAPEATHRPAPRRSRARSRDRVARRPGAPTHPPRLGERLYRVPGTAGTGSGLGLAIVREIAADMARRLLLPREPRRRVVALR